MWSRSILNFWKGTRFNRVIVDRRFRKSLVGHDVQTTREMKREKLDNGVLLRTAANHGFDVLLSIDKKIEHEQNLKTLPLPVIILDSQSNALPALLPFATIVLQLLQSALDRILYIVQPDGTTLHLKAPRS